MNQWYLDNGVTGVIDHDAPGSPESLLVGCAIQTCPAAARAANPITYVEGDEVSTLLLHGFVDPLVPHGQSELLYEALAAAGNEVMFISVDEAGHSPDQIRAGEDFTVFHANRGGHETIGDTPAPTWETIEQFIHVALSRERGG
jgi:acetyl esterase/lipase